MAIRSFRDVIDARAGLVPRWPTPLLAPLQAMPTIAVSQDADLKLQLDNPIPLRYWVSRVNLQDRPTTASGAWVGGWPRVEVEACIDGAWVIIDGYQGHIC